MKKDEIHLWDLKRILFGQAPPEFLIEVFLRSLVVYIAAIIVMRWMGKRMSGQLTIIELSVMVMMGAIISVPMQIPDRGLVQGLLVLGATLFFLRTINWLSFRSDRFEKQVQGQLAILVKDGVLQLPQLAEHRLTNEEVFMALRKENVFNLGQVKRLYLEACGLFAVYQEKEEKPGLPIYPPEDNAVYKERNRTATDVKACCRCGKTQPTSTTHCDNCAGDAWCEAII